MQNSKSKKKVHAFFPLFNKFISDSRRGTRLQANGKRVSKDTIRNYHYLGKHLLNFCQVKKFELRLREEKRLNSREVLSEQIYWKKFYKKFTDYLYQDLGFFDNYVGSLIKNLKAFFNYLNRDTAVKVGQFHKIFYVSRDEIAIFTLLPEELHFLIYDKMFENSLSKRMREVKDVVVFGCTVALRVSDLLKLKKASVRILRNRHYLAVRSQKTLTDTMVLLPDYCLEIILRYKHLKGDLLPKFNKSNLNSSIKILFEKAGFTQEVTVHRSRRGKQMLKGHIKDKEKVLRFCDVASTHIMRRTAITTMLSLGMQEQLVRKISGHAPASKEFYRYVEWSQAYMDKEAERVFGAFQP